jgi:Tannase and feruloyl esterase
MDRVQNWSRMYLVPGMYHCRGGEFALDNFDLLSAVVNWVDNAAAPARSASTSRWRNTQLLPASKIKG